MHLSRKEWDAGLGRTLLVLLLGILVFAPLALGAAHPMQFLVVQALLIASLLVWGTRIWVSPRPQILWPPICWAALAFMILAIARYATADVEYIARQEMIQILVLGFFFFAVINNLFRQEWTQVIVFTLVVVAAGVSFLAIYQYLHHIRHIWGYYSPYPGRAFGTYVSPNDFSCFLELLLPLILAYTLAGRVHVVYRVLLGYAGLVLCAGLFVTLSRGGWVATAAGLVTVFLLLATHRHHRLVAVLLLLLFLLGAGYGAFDYVTHEASISQKSVSEASQRDLKIRLDMWHAAARMWHDYFWFGVGPEHYDVRFRQYRPESMQLQPQEAHNDYLNLLADWGTVGGLVVLGGYIAFIFGLIKTWPHIQRSEGDFNRNGNSNRFAFYVGAAGALAALSVHSFVDFNLHIPANALLGLAWLALLTSNQRFATERYWVNLRPALKCVLTLVFLAGIVYLSAQGWRRVRETMWLNRAEARPYFTVARAACLAKAEEVDPKNFQTIYDLSEIWRVNSFDEPDNYVDLAELAMKGYQRSSALNHYYAYNYLRSGMCLDWLGRHTEATPYFSQAETMDPNGSYVVACIGWHYAQTGDNAAALKWLGRSIGLESTTNVTAGRYIRLINDRLFEDAATNKEFN